MKTRKRRERAVEPNFNSSAVNFTQRLFEDGEKLYEIRLACGHLKRVRQPGAEHLKKFIEHVFTIAGVELEAKAATAEGAQS